MKKILTILVVIILLVLILFFGYILINKKSENPKSSSKEENNTLDIFYSYELTNNYQNIKNLPKDYTVEIAQLDNCFIVTPSTTNNKYIYSEFMSNYRNWTSSFIRIVKSTLDGNTTIYDILYDADLNKVFVVTDNTRNNNISESDKNISLKEFEQIGEYLNGDILYFVAFNDNLSTETFTSSDTLIITEIY